MLFSKIPLKEIKARFVCDELPNNLIDCVVDHYRITYYPTDRQIETYIRHYLTNWDVIRIDGYRFGDQNRYRALRNFVTRQIKESYNVWKNNHPHSRSRWTAKNQKIGLHGFSSLRESSEATDENALFNNAVKSNPQQSG